MSPKSISRSYDQINTSFRTYALMFVATEPGLGNPMLALPMIHEEAQRTMVSMLDTCHSICRSEGIDKCPYLISTTTIEKEIRRRMDAGEDPKDLLEARLKNIRDCWNYPHRVVYCGQEMRRPRPHTTKAITFGKTDLIIGTPFLTQLWSARYRAQLAQQYGVSAVFTVPLYRIKASRAKKADRWGKNKHVIDEVRMQPPDETEEEQNFPRLVVHTFLPIPRISTPMGPGEASKARADWLRDMAEVVCGSNRMRIRDKKLNQMMKDGRAELFLSLSRSYPLVLRTEWRAEPGVVDNLLGFVRTLRDQRGLVDSTASIISLEPGAAGDGPIDFPNISNTGNTNGKGKLDIRLLLKIRLAKTEGESSTRIGSVIAARLVEVVLWPELHDSSPTTSDLAGIITEGKLVEIRERLYYWDVALDFSTGNIHSLMLFLSALRRLPYIEHSAAIPHFEKAEEADLREEDLIRLRDLLDRPQEQPTPDPRITMPQDDLLSILGSIENIISEHTYDAPPGSNICRRTLERLIATATWHQCNLIQLKMSWKSQDPRAAVLAPEEFIPESFDLMLRDLEKHIETLTEEMERVDEAARIDEEFEAQVAEEMLREGLESPNLQQTAERLEIFEGIWNTIESARWSLSTIKNKMLCIAAALNQKSEGGQVLNIVEPYLRVAEQAGSNDLIIDSARRLFRTYCGVLDRKRWPEAWGFKRWQGIVTTSTTSEFRIYPQYKILEAPPDLAMAVHSMLLPLAHESAHQILNLFERNRSAMGRTLDDQDEPAIEQDTTNVGDAFALRIWWPIVRAGVDALFNERNRDLVKRETGMNRRATLETLWKQRLESHEFLADLLAGLCAGPAYFSSLRQLLFRPFYNFPKSEAVYKNYPPEIVRISLGRVMGRALDWFPGGDDPWRLDVALDEDLAANEHLDTWNLFEASLEGPPDAPNLQPETDPLRISVPAHHYLALRRDPSLIREIAKATLDFSVDYLFYPWADEEATRRRQNKRINEMCRLLRDRLFYNDEVILDADLKAIAAASELPGLAGPIYPPGPIIQSLYFSAGRNTRLECIIPRTPDV